MYSNVFDQFVVRGAATVYEAEAVKIGLSYIIYHFRVVVVLKIIRRMQCFVVVSFVVLLNILRKMLCRLDTASKNI